MGEFSELNAIAAVVIGGTALSGFGSFDSKVSADTKAALKKLEEGIIDGSINPLQ
jgi:predicted ABC-type sugar transport system permease subunit